MRKLILLALVLSAGIAAAAGTSISPTLDVIWDTVTVSGDGTAYINLVFLNHTTGARVKTKPAVIDSACSKAIDPETQTVIANPPPAALCTAISGLVSNLTTAVATGASGGKIVP